MITCTREIWPVVFLQLQMYGQKFCSKAQPLRFCVFLLIYSIPIWCSVLRVNVNGHVCSQNTHHLLQLISCYFTALLEVSVVTATATKDTKTVKPWSCALFRWVTTRSAWPWESSAVWAATGTPTSLWLGIGSSSGWPCWTGHRPGVVGVCWNSCRSSIKHVMVTILKNHG